MTLKSLQIELNVLREELKLNRKELVDVKEELKNVKKEMRKETTEDPQEKSRNDYICTVCEQTFGSKKILKKHKQTHYTQSIKCKLCDQSFEKTCDLEVHIT